MRQFGFRKQRRTIHAKSKLATKILYGCKRKEKTAALFFNIEKAYDRINRNKTFKQENMRIRGRMMDFISELISNQWIKVKVDGFTSQKRYRPG